MSSFTKTLLINLTGNLLIGYLIWRYYRNRAYPPRDRYSTFAPRFWTGTVDQCVLAPIVFIAYGIYLLHPPKLLAALVFVVENLGWVLYTVVMHARCGQTVGKMVTKVRVVDFATEGPISWRQAVIREGIPACIGIGILVYQVAAILVGRMTPGDLYQSASQSGSSYSAFFLLQLLWFAAEVVTMLTNPKRRALHDLLAGTVVIRTNTESYEPTLGPAMTQPVASEA